MSSRGVSLLITLAVVGWTQVAGAANEKGQPDVLFIAVDDLNDWISLLDPESPIKTPNLERLAGRGMLFTRAYCISAACNPSRAATMTGLRPSTTGVYGNKSDWRGATPERKTIMQQFMAGGYHVRGAGKIFHHHLEGAFHDGGSFHHFQPMAAQNMPPEKLNRAPEYGSANTDWGAWPNEEADTIDFKTVDYCIGALGKPVGAGPQFLACGIFKPHSPFFAPPKYHEDLPEIPLPPRTEDDLDDLPDGALELMRSKRWFWSGMEKLDGRNPGSYRRFVESYAACCAFADAQIGRLLDALDRSPRKENTIVVLWSDHGFHLGEKNHIEKFALWEKANHIPLIIVAPGVTRAGSKCDKPVDLTVLYPTLLELCGLPKATTCDGDSIVPLLKDPTMEWAKPALMTYGRGNHAVRSERWRYIRYADGSEELYDHSRDPNEWTNLAESEGYEEVMEEHRRWLPTKEAAPVPPLKKKPVGKPAGKSKAAGAPNGKPNVLFLAVDDMKDWVNCMGGYKGRVHTPNIDALASRGTLFTNAHCPSPKCAPSRAAVMTGLMPSTTGIYDNGHWWYPNLPGAATIPAYFRKSGYAVSGAGKIFHHTAGNHPPNQWDDFQRLVFRDDPWFRGVRLNYPWSEHEPFPERYPFSGVEGLGHENDWGVLDLREPDYDDSRSADFAVQFLKESGDEPFFLACGLFRPHLPWYVPKKYFDLYSLDEISLPAVLEDDLGDVPAAGRKFALARRSDFEAISDAGMWKEAVRAYLASISFADAQLGRVLQALDKSGKQESTIVVLWSDHGWHLGEKGHWHKSTLWEEATRVPFIVSVPPAIDENIEPGLCNRPVSLIDIYPTLNDFCGLPEIAALDGKSLRPLLRNSAARWDRPAVIEYKRGNAAVRSERYRYIRYADGGEEFYDLQSDPDEWHNLAGERRFDKVIEDHRKWLPDKWAESAPTKGAFQFDPESFTWTEKKTGRKIIGK